MKVPRYWSEALGWVTIPEREESDSWEVWEYATSPSRTIHLIRQDEVADYYAAGFPMHEGSPRLRTLCGREVTMDWEMGDETVSGLTTTCERCRRSARRARSN